MSMAPHRVALIGTGRVGYQFDFGQQQPENHAAAVAAHPCFELVAGVNRSRTKLDEFGRRFGVETLYTDLKAMLAEVAPSVCIVATPPQFHLEVVEACAATGSVRAIICEKPMALSLDECDRMIDACERTSTLLQINHNRRWHPEWLQVQALLESGAIGDLVHIRAHIDGGKPAPWWTSDYEGPLLHDCTHWLDVIDMYAGPAAWVLGFVEQRRRPYTVEDFAAAIIKYTSGVTATLHSAELTDYGDSAIELRGTVGMIRVRGERAELTHIVDSDFEPDSGFRWHRLDDVDLEHPEPVSTYVRALDDLAAALADGGPLRSDGRVARRSIELVMGIYQSHLAGNRPVHLPVTLHERGIDKLRAAGVVTAQPDASAGDPRAADDRRTP